MGKFWRYRLDSKEKCYGNTSIKSGSQLRLLMNCLNGGLRPSTNLPWYLPRSAFVYYLLHRNERVPVLKKDQKIQCHARRHSGPLRSYLAVCQYSICHLIFQPDFNLGWDHKRWRCPLPNFEDPPCRYLGYVPQDLCRKSIVFYASAIVTRHWQWLLRWYLVECIK